jgi:hypothetical protein
MTSAPRTWALPDYGRSIPYEQRGSVRTHGVQSSAVPTIVGRFKRTTILVLLVASCLVALLDLYLLFSSIPR